MSYVVIWQVANSFYQAAWMSNPGSTAISNAAPSGATLRYSGDTSEVPLALKNEVIAAEPITPDWQNLTDSIPVDVASILHSHNPFLTARLIRLGSHPNLWENANDKFFGHWNTPNPPALTAEQRTEMNAALTASNIPAVVNADNTLSYSA